jgi:hypothetical protein
MKSWKWKRLLILIPALLLNISVMGIGSCEELMECFCGSDQKLTGNTKVDAWLSAADELTAAGDRVWARTDAAMTKLAVLLGLPETATAEQIQAALCEKFSSASLTFHMEAEPAKCTVDVDVAAKAAAECDVSYTPGSVELNCSGHCEGSCQGTCSAQCTMPSVSARCSGECHGSCSVEVSGACYGTCKGQCSGSCSVMEGSQCAGSCEGTCTGYCETRVEGSCSGGCSGECTVATSPGGCTGRCEGSCSGHCEGRCDAEVTPAQIDADCRAEVEARVEANMECEPPKVDFGIDASGLENIAEISAQMGELFAALEEAGKVNDALGNYIVSFGDAITSIFNADLSADQLACMVANNTFANALSALQAVQITVQAAVEIQSVLMPGMTCL